MRPRSTVFAEMRAEAEAIVRRGAAGAPRSPNSALRSCAIAGRATRLRLICLFANSPPPTAQHHRIVRGRLSQALQPPDSGGRDRDLELGLSLSAPSEGNSRRRPRNSRANRSRARARQLFDPASGAFIDTPVYRRADLAPGAAIKGPAVITEDDTSTVVSPRSTRASTNSAILNSFADELTMVARPNAALAQIQAQIMWNRLIAVVEEQAQTMVRTAFRTSVREAGDLSAGVFDRDGHMLAQAVTGTPGHVNSMAKAVKHFLDVYPLAQHEARRPLHHQRSVADLRPSARHDGGHPDLLSRRSRSACSPTPSMSSISAGSAWGRTGGRCSRRGSRFRSCRSPAKAT